MPHDKALLKQLKEAAKQKRPTGLNPKRPWFSSPMQMGSSMGMGVGTYFMLLKWWVPRRAWTRKNGVPYVCPDTRAPLLLPARRLPLVFCLMSLTSIPFLVLIRYGRWTAEQYRANEAFGVTTQAPGTLPSYSFAAFVSPETDNNQVRVSCNHQP